MLHSLEVSTLHITWCKGIAEHILAAEGEILLLFDDLMSFGLIQVSESDLLKAYYSKNKKKLTKISMCFSFLSHPTVSVSPLSCVFL